MSGWLIGTLLFWLAAWAVNVSLANGRFARRRWVRIVVPLLFGVTVLVLWEGVVRGLGVPGAILPPPSAIGLAVWRNADLLREDFVQTFLKGALTGWAIGSAAALLTAVAIDLSLIHI